MLQIGSRVLVVQTNETGTAIEFRDNKIVVELHDNVRTTNVYTTSDLKELEWPKRTLNLMSHRRGY